ncbi:GDP-mannose mannosyl hydrolase [Ectothiorhodospira lacustris]|uniref:GDP-mannose mannosyl hydrolase n=1 Tax=Ectothiorhodospira lacustris TaxID=2899127 RepID=UPI001EE935E2|nr:GDP-mannose mannosyl hydrolase [Ectothiorhodospira lacustris]MCG5510651.1 GDP-mannose mannosyl hydrolase [Ectothiorhodospira lacustris]MCG5522449.1 GDP-mannose mannosyl hydrolase [Ectothiorhodospira lacustris]
MSWLDAETFRGVVEATPLVSIDLVVRDTEGRILLGRRNNRPAQGYWFVPGGRIRKNETLDAAFARLTQEELGQPSERSAARLMGVYEHLYEDSVFGTAPSTHYVVLGYTLCCPIPADSLQLPRKQHGEYRWWAPAAALASEWVHDNTKAYLKPCE